MCNEKRIRREFLLFCTYLQIYHTACRRINYRALPTLPYPNTTMSLYVRDPLFGRLVRIIMKDGKKHSALRIVDSAFNILRQEHGIERPSEFAREAIDNAKPLVETRKYRASGRAIQVPTPCRPERQESLALRHLRYDKSNHNS